MNRLRIIALLDEMPSCVCHLEKILGIGSVRTSQQLAYLKRHGLVEVEIRGTWRVYSLSDHAGTEFEAIRSILRGSLFCNEPFRSDLALLRSRSACP